MHPLYTAQQVSYFDYAVVGAYTQLWTAVMTSIPIEYILQCNPFTQPTYTYMYLSSIRSACSTCSVKQNHISLLSFIIVSISHLRIVCLNDCSIHLSGIILCIRQANERRRYNVTSSLICWAHTQNVPWWVVLSSVITNNSLHSYIMRFPTTISCSLSDWYQPHSLIDTDIQGAGIYQRWAQCWGY